MRVGLKGVLIYKGNSGAGRLLVNHRPETTAGGRLFVQPESVPASLRCNYMPFKHALGTRSGHSLTFITTYYTREQEKSTDSQTRLSVRRFPDAFPDSQTRSASSCLQSGSYQHFNQMITVICMNNKASHELICCNSVQEMGKASYLLTPNVLDSSHSHPKLVSLAKGLCFAVKSPALVTSRLQLSPAARPYSSDTQHHKSRHTTAWLLQTLKSTCDRLNLSSYSREGE